MTLSAQRILDRCDALAQCSETPGALTRVYLSPQLREDRKSTRLNSSHRT